MPELVQSKIPGFPATWKETPKKLELQFSRKLLKEETRKFISH